MSCGTDEFSIGRVGSPLREHAVCFIGTGTGTGAGTTSASSGSLVTLLLIAWKFFAALLVLSTTVMAMSSIPEAVM